MRTLTSGTLTVKAYDANVWIQERNVLRISDPGSTKVSIGTTTSTQFATYRLDNNHRAVVDVSDYIRTHAAATNIYVSTDGGARVNANYIPVGLINPANVIIPETDIAFQALVAFPRVYLQAINGVASSFEMRGFPSGSGLEYEGYGVDFVDGSNVLPASIVSFNYGNGQTGEYGTFYLRLIDCEKRYASVRWQSFTGATRCHTLEVRDVNHSANEVINLETLDGSYNQIKGRTDGFKLYLEDLDEYDYWYYSDIITSSKVEVSLDGQTWNQVEVNTKSVTIPNTSAGATNKLEIAVNWRKYDAVTM